MQLLARNPKATGHMSYKNRITNWENRTSQADKGKHAKGKSEQTGMHDRLHDAAFAHSVS